DISIKKAYTSRAFDISTKDLATHSQSGGQFFGIHASNDGRIMIFAGGIPLKKDGKVVGAIGVSGGSGDQDHAVAEAGAQALYAAASPGARQPAESESCRKERSMASNRGVVYLGPGKVEIQSIDYPRMRAPDGRDIDHGVILRIVATNICGSDQHMVRGRTTAPVGL